MPPPEPRLFGLRCCPKSGPSPLLGGVGDPNHLSPGPRVRPQDGADDWLPINGEAVHSLLLQDEHHQAVLPPECHIFMASQDDSVQLTQFECKNGPQDDQLAHTNQSSGGVAADLLQTIPDWSISRQPVTPSMPLHAATAGGL